MRDAMNHKQSEKLYKEAREHIPGGVNSPVRAFKSVGGTPLVIEKALASRIFDADNNSYIDYVMSWGALVLGHCHPLVAAGIKEAVDKGTSFGAPTSREGDVARKICGAIPSIEKVRLVNSGTEATMSAIRLARGFTARDKVIKFEGCYHGSVDSLLVKAGSGQATLGIPTSAGITRALAADTLVCPFNDIDAFQDLVKAYHQDIAGCIIEPVCGNMGVVMPRQGFLSAIREITEKYNIVLIFDEVMTGFRFCYGGAQNIFGINPDLTCLGKIIGGGLPCGAYGGRGDIMEKVAPLGDVYQAGTLSGNPLAVTAGSVTLDILSTMDYRELDKKTKGLCAGIGESCRRAGVDHQINSFGSMFTLFFTGDKVYDFATAKTADSAAFGRYFWKMLESGINLAPSQFEANFVSFSHSSDDIARTIEAGRDACAAAG